MSDARDCRCAELRQAHAGGAQLVDVRTRQEYVNGALAGAINLPLQHFTAAHEVLDRARPVLLYCHSGIRSEQARNMLVAMGFGSVLNIGGYEHYRHCD